MMVKVGMGLVWATWRRSRKIPCYGPKRVWFGENYRWWPLVWKGGDEWCNPTLVVGLPGAGWGMIINLSRKMREERCDECRRSWR